MAIQLERHLFTLEEFERMVETGAFEEDTRIELIRGEIVNMAPIGFPREMCVMRLNRLLIQVVGNKAIVWPQNNSIQLAGNSRPQPDLTLLRLREYQRASPPTAEDVLVVIEVAETSIGHDRKVKGPLYAEAGISEYWIVNLRRSIIEVYTNPTEGAYKQARKARRGETLALPAEIGGAIVVNDILGQSG